MSYSQKQLREKFSAWGVWRLNGGWDYYDPLTTDNGVKIRAPGTHTDPTMSHLLGMERARDCEQATVDGYINGLPKVTKSLVYATYYYALMDKDGASAAAIVRDYGISTRVYYDQMRLAVRGLGWHMEAIEAQKEAA